MKHELTIEKFFESPPATVYQAWANPELLSQWMGPGNVSCKKVDAELKVGGSYEIHMQTDDGIKIACGVYKTIEPYHALAFTWRWKDTDMPESLVTLTFSWHRYATSSHTVAIERISQSPYLRMEWQH